MPDALEITGLIAWPSGYKGAFIPVENGRSAFTSTVKKGEFYIQLHAPYNVHAPAHFFS